MGLAPRMKLASISILLPMQFTMVKYPSSGTSASCSHLQGFGRLSIHALATNATHAPGYAELDVHNIWGLMEERATHLAVQDIIPGKRPFLISRSTFASAGKWTGHWVCVNNAAQEEA